jgi:anionic cell wall polymer biosynthesis LytR-Cps2A-Psr (LCP) family protein
LARARGDGYGSYGFPNSDFDRTEHQRQLFIAVAEKAKTLGVIANPIKISDLFNALGNNFQTDLKLQDVLQLIQITKNINPSTVQSYSYTATLTGNTNPILKGYIDPASGEDALIPTAGIGNFSQMTDYYNSLVAASGQSQK